MHTATRSRAATPESSPQGGAPPQTVDVGIHRFSFSALTTSSADMGLASA
jgi:hypothetical protein